MEIREKMFELIIEHNSHHAVICDRCLSDTPEEHNSKIYGLIDHLIANGMTIEAEPVKHGRWVDKMVRDWHCSECGEKLAGHGWDGYCYDDLPNYCPNCGAKMDGGEVE